MKVPSLYDTVRVLGDKGHVVFEDVNGKGYDLNIVGIRANSDVSNRFDDLLIVFYKTHAGWDFFSYPATTDPGRYWLGSRHGGRMGTAILKEGQYRSTYQIGMHQGKYEALVQRKPVTVIRDYDRDGQLTYDSDREETGLFGINIHRAHAQSTLLDVSAWSAGCQVLQSPKHFDHFMALCRNARESYGNSFTYSLLHERDFG